VAGDPAGDGLYRRFAVLAGVVLHATTRPALVRPPPVQDDEDVRPMVKDGRVRFRVRAPGATSVQVLGSWDDWAAPGQALSSTRAPGVWELWLALPPGAHRYHFMVDGVLTRPSNAARYMPDGFGGEDGVVEVSEGTVVSSDATGSYVR
jgi:1,4-alpha-glucan branching enzyme